jgi:phosphosulfolactate synthase (CoM biosynthesis protein A)
MFNKEVLKNKILDIEINMLKEVPVKVHAADVLTYKEKGANMIMDIYLNMVTNLGFPSLEKAEKLTQKAAQYQHTQISDN